MLNETYETLYTEYYTGYKSKTISYGEILVL